jgi:hypothetical protein
MEILIPIILGVCLFSVIGLKIKSRHTERMELIRQGIVPKSIPHTERMELIRQGLVPESIPHVPRLQGTWALFLGLLAVGIGLALIISAIFILEFDRDTLTSGVILSFGGAAMLIYWRMVSRMASSSTDNAAAKKEIEDDTRIS